MITVIFGLIYKTPVTPNGDVTAFVQRSENMSAQCEVVAKYAKNQFASDSMQTHSLQRLYSVHSTWLQRPCSAHDAQKIYGASEVATVRSRRAHSV